MDRRRLKNVALTLLALTFALPALGQQSQQSDNNPQTTQQNQDLGPTPNVVADSAQQMAAKAAAARRAGQIAPSREQQITATCKVTDPPPRQTELLLAPAAGCGTQLQAAPDRPKNDSDLTFDTLLGYTVEKGTGLPTDAIGAYQTLGTETGSAALDVAADKMNSEFLSRAAAIVVSDTLTVPLSIGLASSEGGSPQLDNMTLDQFRAYQQNQFDQLQSNFFLQNPATFCFLNPTNPRCGAPQQPQSQVLPRTNPAPGATQPAKAITPPVQQNPSSCAPNSRVCR
jgi:hypothetical protein